MKYAKSHLIWFLVGIFLMLGFTQVVVCYQPATQFIEVTTYITNSTESQKPNESSNLGDCTPPIPPTIIDDKAEGSHHAPFLPIFQWSTVNPDSTYEIEFSTNQDFAGATLLTAGAGKTTAQPAEALNPTETSLYFWRIRAKLSTSCYSDWIEADHFTIWKGVTGPETICEYDIPEFSWTALNEKVILEMGTQEGYTQVYADTQNTYTLTDPEPGTYMWRIRLDRDTYMSDWLYQNYFTIHKTPKEPIPVPCSPTGASTGQYSPQFEWTTIETYHHYEIQLDTSPGWTTETTYTSSEDETSYTASTLLDPSTFTTYVWRIRAKNAAGCTSNWVEGDPFTIKEHPLSCFDLLQENPSAPDGTYTIDPDGPCQGLDPFSVYCDMTTDGGGWTLVIAMNEYQDNVDGPSVDKIEPTPSDLTIPPGNNEIYKFSDTTINLILQATSSAPEDNVGIRLSPANYPDKYGLKTCSWISNVTTDNHPNDPAGDCLKYKTEYTGAWQDGVGIAGGTACASVGIGYAGSGGSTCVTADSRFVSFYLVNCPPSRQDRAFHNHWCNGSNGSSEGYVWVK